MTMSHHQPPREAVPNLAPMVDVIMVLLVFFMLGATMNLTEQGILQTELDPRSGPNAGAAVIVNPRITIALQSAGADRVRITLIDEDLGENAFDRLRETLRLRRAAGADPTNPVVIGAEPAVHWKYVVEAMDAAVRAGFQNIQFAVSLRPTGS